MPNKAGEICCKDVKVIDKDFDEIPHSSDCGVQSDNEWISTDVNNPRYQQYLSNNEIVEAVQEDIPPTSEDMNNMDSGLPYKNT